jgi:1-aminocyclopropane-1-carboxylate deaminase
MSSIVMERPTPLQEITDVRLESAGVRLFVKRDDLANSPLSGNKARKLKYNLLEARRQNHTRIATFGGAYSNHIRATALAGKLYGFQTFGFIRGEEERALNTVLQFAVACGMQLIPVDRSRYRDKSSAVMKQWIFDICGDCYLLPEGGTNALAVQGCAEIVPELDQDFDLICCAVGTGGTLAGIAQSLKPGQRAMGFSALKGGAFLRDDVTQWLEGAQSNWSICADYSFGGYAKTMPELLAFIADFTARTGVPLDPVYTGKMFFGIYDLIARGTFTRGTTIVAVHSGGYC